jgi:phage-related baseplate assembly protein
VDLEAPADAWYVWLGVAVVSIGLAGIVAGLPAQPPPDAARVTSAIDSVAATEHAATATVDHDATAVRIGAERIALRNDGGTTHARIAYGRMVDVRTVAPARREPLLALLNRTTTADQHRDLLREVADATTTGDWRPAGDTLRVRSVTVDDSTVLLIDV